MKVRKKKVKKIIMTLLVIFIALIISPFIDFNMLLKPIYLIGKTNERKLTEIDGVMYKRGKPFTGCALLIGKYIMESYINEEIDERGVHHMTVEDGRRITHYKNGLKDGVEKAYYTERNSLFGMLGGPDIIRTDLATCTEYKQGVKHGTELLYNCSNLISESQYENGLLHGISKEYEYAFLSKYTNAKNIARNIGPLLKEVEYKSGRPDGFYRTYTTDGDIVEDYIIQNGRILSGRRMHVIDADTIDYMEKVDIRYTCWEYYKDDELIRKELYEQFAQDFPPNRTRFSLFCEEWYENGILTQQCIYNDENNKVIIHRKMHNGILIDIYNRDLGINRIAEFETEQQEQEGQQEQQE